MTRAAKDPLCGRNVILEQFPWGKHDHRNRPREAFAERLIEDVTRSLEVFSVYLGVKLGIYRALADLDSAVATEVALAAGIDPRYSREWLEHQATAGYIACENPDDEPDKRRFSLPEAHAEVLLAGDSLYHAGPATLMLGGVAGVLPQLLEAYRTGGGVPYSAYGQDIRRGIATLNRPQFLHEMGGWLAAVPGLDRRLREAPAPRLLDLGCGCGHSAFALARVYPNATVLGVDLDKESIAEAREAADEEGLADRVSFSDVDAASLVAEQRFDLVTMFETLHDMGDPVGVLRTSRALLADGGTVMVADERISDGLAVPGDLLERFQFGWSVTHCLPATLAEDPVEANGTMLRSSTMARWAGEAGFEEFAIAPIENDFWRFYLMRE
ncbi:class I SAM-dependent methyltransferase [Glycomyces albus]